MKSKELKIKISHAHSLILSLVLRSQQTQLYALAVRLAHSSVTVSLPAVHTLLIELLTLGLIWSQAYSFTYDCHRSYYSFVLSCSAALVYTLGFVLMTPQLFINYKLKSVAHLPWRRFVYRAINTFIDDLFSFIIRMPTMHRLSCFRSRLMHCTRYVLARVCLQLSAVCLQRRCCLHRVFVATVGLPCGQGPLIRRGRWRAPKERLRRASKEGFDTKLL